MEEKHHEEDREVPLRKLFDRSSKTADVQPDGRENKRWTHSLAQVPADGHFSCTTKPGQSNFQIPGIETPGISFDPYITGWPLTTVIDGLGTDWASCIEQFHDSEAEDVYDLYNACNGAIHEGFLDIRKLAELSAEELEVLDIERLREIWLHTKSGCGTCADIIRTLNSVRGVVVEAEEEEGVLQEQIHSIEGEPH